MGDRVLMQCINSKTGEVGPSVYGHWCGSAAPQIANRLVERMHTRPADVQYASARLVQEMLAEVNPQGNTGIGLMNRTAPLNEHDSHGDAGCVLIDVGARPFKVRYFGGYLTPEGVYMTDDEQRQQAFYARLQAQA